MKITLIKNNFVENVIECKSLLEAITLFPGHECKTHNLETIGDEMLNGAVKTHAPINKIIIVTKTEFLARFSDAELAAIYSHDLTDVGIKILLDKVNNAIEIDLTSAELAEGMGYLQSQGYLTLARMNEILA